jgi:hypothetical protein
MVFCSLGLLACPGEHHPSTSVSARSEPAVCPYGIAADPARTLELVTLLRQDPEGKPLLDQTADDYLVCYGNGLESAIDTEHRLRLPHDQPAEVLSARMAHLLEHLRIPLPAFSEEPSMTQTEALASGEHWLEQVQEREASAHDLENRVRQRRGLAPLPSAALRRVLDQYRWRYGVLQSPNSRGASLTDARAGR